MQINANLMRAHFNKQRDIFSQMVTGRSIVDLFQRYDLDQDRHERSDYIELFERIRGGQGHFQDLKKVFIEALSDEAIFFEIQSLDKALEELPFTFIDGVGDIILHKPYKDWVGIYKSSYELAQTWALELGYKAMEVDYFRLLGLAAKLVRKYHFDKQLKNLI